MAEPNPNWNPPPGPRRRYLRGRGQGPASTVPTPAPRTLRGQNESQDSSTQNPHHYSDPFHSNTQSVPYWDDYNGAIHGIPSCPPQHLARSYAQIVSGETRGTRGPQKSGHLQISSQSAFNNPYTEIVGSEPCAPNQASFTTYTAPVTRIEPAVKETKDEKSDFTPYFDAADARNGRDLGRTEKDSFRAALATKDANKEVRGEAMYTIKTATTRRDRAQTRDLVVLMNGSEPKSPPKAHGGHEPPIPPTMFKSKFEAPTSPKIPKAGLAHSSKPTNWQELNSLYPVVEAPSPLKVFLQEQPTPHPKHERTPTLNRILELRAEEQAKALATPEGDTVGSRRPRRNERQAPRAPSRKISDSESQPVDEITSRDQKRHTSEFIANLDTLKSGEWQDVCMMNDPAAPPATAHPVEKDEMSSSDEIAQENEIDRLTKAVTDLRLFQDLPSPSPNRTGFHPNSAMPVSLNVSKIEAGKGESEDGYEASRLKTWAEAQAELLKVLNAPDTNVAKDGAGMQRLHENSSAESFATASSEDYEQIVAEEELLTEQNGVKRRWYTGFRKV